MPTPYEAALMSYLAYSFKKNHLETTFEQSKPKENQLLYVFNRLSPAPGNNEQIFIHFLNNKGWQYFGSKPKAEDRRDLLLCGYQCVVFINHQTKEIVMAHRGTVTEDNEGARPNIQDDIRILKGAQGESPFILPFAMLFMREVVRKRDENYPDYIIHHTGHSLGGFVSECCAAYLAQPSQTFPKESIVPDFWKPLRIARPKDANAITFDSLGSGNVLPKIGCSSTNTKIINYLPQPNIANTANPHAGERRLLYKNGQPISTSGHERKVKWNSETSLNIDQEFFDTFNSHSLENIITAFNPKTGDPYSEQVITKWPHAINTFDESKQLAIPTVNINPNLSFLEYLLRVIIPALVSLGVQTKTGGVTQFTHTRTGRISLQTLNPTSTSSVSQPFATTSTQASYQSHQPPIPSRTPSPSFDGKN